MNRRRFIACAAAPLMGAVPPPPAYGIVDTHVHFYDPTRPAGVPWPPKTDSLLYRKVMPADLERVAAPLGVTSVVVVEASAWVADNQWVLDLAAANPLIRGLVGNIQPGPDFRTSLATYSRNPLFRGIRLGQKVLEGAGPDLVDNMKRLADQRLTLDAIGAATMFDAVRKIAERVPSLHIVINHLPFDTNVDGLGKLAEHPGIFAKVSGNLRPDGIEQVWSAFGAKRVIYGSNWPVSERAGSYADRLAVVRKFFEGQSAGVAEQYFRLNARDAYRLSL